MSSNKSSVVLSVRVSPEIKKAFHEAVKDEGVSCRALMERVITKYIEAQSPEA